MNKKKLFTNLRSCIHTVSKDMQHPHPAKAKVSINYDYFINDLSRRRTPSALREITSVISKLTKPITLAVGVPNVNTFPFKKFSIQLKDGSNYTLEDRELESALQYLPSKGYGKLTDLLQGFQDRIHGPQDWNSRSIVITSGGQESLHDALCMCITPGTSIIIPHPLYPGSIDIMRPLQPNIIAIEQDKYGVNPNRLQEELEKCKRKGNPLPKLMYINPIACNPSGVSVTNERKKHIYKLACEYNFLILEDDPYYFLHFMKENPESFLSMDTEGRVLRMDSFSKILSSGLRVGFVTGPLTLLRRIELHLQVSSLHTSGLSQVIVYKLLNEWGENGFENHISKVRQFYKSKRDCLLEACNRHLRDLAEWEEPSGGMFLWVKIKGLKDTFHLASKTCLDKSLVIVPGQPFNGVDPKTPSNYVRLSYSLAEPWEMEEGCKMLAELVRKEIQDFPEFT